MSGRESGVEAAGSRAVLERMLALAEGSRKAGRSGVEASRRPREEEVEARGAAGVRKAVGRAWEMVLARTWVRRSGKREVRVARRLVDGVDEADDDDDDDSDAGSCGRGTTGCWEAAVGSFWAAATLSDEAGAPGTSASGCGGSGCGLGLFAAGGREVWDWDERESAGGSSAVLIDI